MRLHFLDVGDEKYGDCVLVECGGLRILVDGAHPGDFRQRGASPSVPDQLGTILGAPPFVIDLLVVTHCHVDHIGCLPTLVSNGTIKAEWALVADPDLGFPALDAGPSGQDPADIIVDQVVAALREEPRTDFRSDAECQQFLADAANLEQRYRQMLDALRNARTKVVLFQGTDDQSADGGLAALVAAFRGIGLEILGPTQNHLLLCTEAIAKSAESARTAATRARSGDSVGVAASAATLYRFLTRSFLSGDSGLPDSVAEFIDTPGRGAALNNQSIVLKLNSGSGAVLLTGDMQLAKPEIKGLGVFMAKQLKGITAAGPYALVKLPHHGSYNGFADGVVEALSDTKSYVISTGRGDPAHPEKSVVALLQENRDKWAWARTDKNGLILATVADGATKFELARGRLNDPTANIASDEGLTIEAPTVEAPLKTVGARPPEPPVQPASTMRQGGQGRPGVPETAAVNSVEVTARIPHLRTRVTITVDVEPGGAVGVEAKVAAPKGGPISLPTDRTWSPLAGGKRLPPLVFATSMDGLSVAVGSETAAAVAACVRDAGQTLVDVQNLQDPLPEIRQVGKQAGAKGVVLIGGYDVLRSFAYDVLPTNLRNSLGRGTGDPDDFIVWSDQIYGDLDGDQMADVPVSRIPDGHSPELLERALSCTAPALSPRRYGLRNVARPFAENVFGALDGTEVLNISEPASAGSTITAELDTAAIYLMLHGSEADGSRFWGERRGGGTLEALRSSNIPRLQGGVVFAGCCWGALTVDTPANQHRPGREIAVRRAAESMALTFLLNGARAFVGCTGAHYSPFSRDPAASLEYFGGPMHRSFWAHLQAGNPPALALFNAKVDYIGGMPHGRRTAEEQAIEYKILREFTCLGLGWC